VIVDICIFIIVLTGAIATYSFPQTRKIKSLFFIGIGMAFQSLLFLFEALGMLLLNPALKILDGVISVPGVIFFIIGINYIFKETYNSISLIIAFSLGILITYLAFLPNATTGIIEEAGYLTINWSGLFGLLTDLYQGYFAGIVFFWGLKTWLNAPFLIRKEALIFFIGICFLPISLVVYIFTIIHPQIILLTDILAVIGTIIYIFSILREPKLVYILPFTIYRILVKDRRGNPLFDLDWSFSSINEKMFTGFINAVQLMSEEVMNMGGLLDINLEDGILIVHESRLITVGLAASKSSKLLRRSLVNFTFDFQNRFKKELKEECREMKKYEATYELLEKHFSNFPYRIIPSKKHPLLLSGNKMKIPLELENKLKKIIPDDYDLEFIKSEINKAPLSLIEEFFDLFYELSNEPENLLDGERKLLENDPKSGK
jgi:hypothetical protein